MTSAVEIRDAGDPAARLVLEVVQCTAEGTVFRCTFGNGIFQGSVNANSYLTGPPSALFTDIAREWRGWKGTKVWQDRDYALTLKAECPDGGTVALSVEMRFDQPPVLTTLASRMFLESAALDGVAEDVASLFREDQSREFLKRLGGRG